MSDQNAPRSAAGVVCEFDPFHRGHRWLLEQLRAACPDKGIVCVMSGGFTQRGTAAALDRSDRAEMALRGGADLVLELPLLWAASSAETFARGGVGCLLDTGVVDTVAFGSEDGDLSRLAPAARGLDSDALQPLLRAGLEEGLSYPAARQQALERLIGAAGRCLETPNNNLGVEYLRALRHWGREDVTALTFPRQGAGHDSQQETAWPSGSLLRQWMCDGNWARLETALPPSSWEIVAREREAGRCPARLEACERGVLARLRSMTEEELSALPDCAPGLEHRLARAAGEATTLAQFYDRAKTRRYPEARIRRMALWAFLGLNVDRRPERVPYLRVLGFNCRGQALLREMKVRSHLPVVLRSGQIRRLGADAQAVFQAECRGEDLRQLCLPRPGPGGQEWLRTPVCLTSPDLDGWG
ncbi:MAG: nucleotidyltransferase family protein [Clostridiales bacterium]|nr:nucleotidyltransferase family protein [Clostridiales bacterium]